MAFKSPSTSTIIDNNGSLIHESFKKLTGTVQQTEIQKLNSYDYGYSISIADGRIVVGAWLDMNIQGSVTIYDLDGNQLNKIISPNPSFLQFGFSVAVGHGRIVVSHLGDMNYRGSVYMYDLDGNFISKIVASDGMQSDEFGRSVAIGNGKIVVGARSANNDKGAVYIFDLSGVQLNKLVDPSGSIEDDYGCTVLVGNGRIVVSAIGVNGEDPFSMFYSNAGAVYIYSLDGSLIKRISSPPYADYFGNSIALGDGRIVVGSEYEQVYAGACYIYDLDGNLVKKLIAWDDSTPYDNFGFGFGRTVQVGSGKIFVQNSGNSGRGKVYVYDTNGNFMFDLLASDALPSNQFGKEISVGNNKLAIASDKPYPSKGSIYIYELPENFDTYIENVLNK